MGLSLRAGAFAGRETAQLRELGERRLVDWVAALETADLPLSRAFLCGSIETGLLDGTKPASYSGSPWPPPRPNIVELDIRVVLAGGTDCLDRPLLDRISRLTGTRLARAGTITRWERRIPMAVFYAHDVVNDICAIEWEMCVNVEPYFETSPFWADVFDAGELSVQRRARAASFGQNISRPEYEDLKEFYGKEFRWRLSSGIALLPAEVLPRSIRLLATDVDRFPAVRALVDKAGRGQFPRPVIPDLVRRLQTEAQSAGTPTSPGWVRLLEADRSWRPLGSSDSAVPGP